MENQKLRLLFLIIFLAVFGFFPLISLAAGLVPCGGPGQDPCRLCHFFVLFKNIIDFLLIPGPLNSGLPIVPLIATVMMVVGGLMFYLGGASPGTLTKAKSLLTSVVIGLIIIYGAWVIINTFFMFIGVADWTGLKEGWWKIKCP